jgi:signal peptidase I
MRGMSWEHHKDCLADGKDVSFRPRGNSMKPKIESGQLVTVSPIAGSLAEGDIVFCKVKGKFYVHLIKAIEGDRYQIGNNKGHVNGWVGRSAIFGKVTKVEA